MLCDENKMNEDPTVTRAADGLVIQKVILKRHAGAVNNVQAAAAGDLPGMMMIRMMIADLDPVDVDAHHKMMMMMKAADGLVIHAGMQRQQERDGKIAVVVADPPVMMMMMIVVDAVAEVAVGLHVMMMKDVDGLAIHADMRKQQEWVGKVAVAEMAGVVLPVMMMMMKTEVDAVAIADLRIMMMKDVAGLVMKEDIPKPPAEAGETGTKSKKMPTDILPAFFL
jgi:hypothetical protein